MRRKAMYYVAAFLLGLSFVIPQRAFAGIPEGTLCFQDNYGELWFLDYGSFLSDIDFDVHGFMIGNSECDGTFVQPVSGTATFENDTVVVGVVSNGGSTGACASASWHAPVDLNTFQGSGSWQDLQTGEVSAFSLSLIDCNTVLAARRSLQKTGLKGLSKR